MKQRNAERGTSGRVNRNDSIDIRVFWRGSGFWLRLNAEQLHNLREGWDALLFRPRLDLGRRQLQHLRKMRVALEGQLRPQRALSHTTVDQRSDGRTLGIFRRSKDHGFLWDLFRPKALGLALNCSGQTWAGPLASPACRELPQILGTSTASLGEDDAAAHVRDVGE